MRKLLIKLFQGGISVKVGKKYLSVSKLAPYGTLGFLLMGLTQPGAYYCLPLLILGMALTAITLFMFFYFNFKPLSREEVAEFFPEMLEDYDRFNKK